VRTHFTPTERALLGIAVLALLVLLSPVLRAVLAGA
jgi:hypothetical protein